jgi:hypothetical protein
MLSRAATMASRSPSSTVQEIVHPGVLSTNTGTSRRTAIVFPGKSGTTSSGALLGPAEPRCGKCPPTPQLRLLRSVYSPLNLTHGREERLSFGRHAGVEGGKGHLAGALHFIHLSPARQGSAYAVGLVGWAAKRCILGEWPSDAGIRADWGPLSSTSPSLDGGDSWSDGETSQEQLDSPRADVYPADTSPTRPTILRRRQWSSRFDG